MSSVLIGQIVNVHGIKGEVKIYPYTDDVENLAMKLKKIYLDEAMKQGSYKISCRIQKGMLLAIISKELTSSGKVIPFSIISRIDLGEV